MSKHFKAMFSHILVSTSKKNNILDLLIFSILWYLSEGVTSYYLYDQFQRQRVFGTGRYGAYAIMSHVSDYGIAPYLASRFSLAGIVGYSAFWFIADFLTLVWYMRLRKDWFMLEKAKEELEEKMQERKENANTMFKYYWVRILTWVLGTDNKWSLYPKVVLLSLEFNPFMVVILTTRGFNLTMKKVIIYLVSFIVSNGWWAFLLWILYR